LTAVVPTGRFGAVDLDGPKVKGFMEKPPGDNTVVNGGFFVLQPAVLDRIAGDTTSWESEPLEKLARDGELMAYRHTGFWQPMDTLRDKNALEDLWRAGAAPWKIWS
jgi:glucose-1-phosphate cytidylyltransferase